MLLTRGLHLIIAIVLSMFASCSNDELLEPKEKKLLIIGIDGCRPDILEQVTTPAIDKLIDNGVYSYKAQTDKISYSGPCWSSMLTGVWSEKHQILTNSTNPQHLDVYPHFFNRIKEMNPAKKTYSIIHWQPINALLQEGDADVAEHYNSDEEVTQRTINVLSKEDPDVLFMHLDDVDHAGHAYGYSIGQEEYVKAVKKIDNWIEDVVNAIEKRKTYHEEDWLIIVSTDHGGSGRSHGLNIPEHTTIFFIASGEAALKGQILNVNVTDVAATALYHMGVDLQQSWRLDGTVKGLRSK